MIDPKGRCDTCKWARFQMTKHDPPRINRNHYGFCDWPLPEAIPIALCFVVANPHRTAIWADYANCPVWGPKEAPLSRSCDGGGE